MNATQEGNAALFCSTDREKCCVKEFNIPGSWFLPNGSKISSSSTNTSLYNIALGDQTVGLNISPDLPRGLYHCEMMDRDNMTHHLYAGIYLEDEGTMQYMLKIIIANVLLAKGLLIDKNLIF